MTDDEKKSITIFGMPVVYDSSVPADMFRLVNRDGVAVDFRVSALDELAEAVCGDD